MSAQPHNAEQARLEVWWCDRCGYGRLEKSTGVHMVPNPEDWRGRPVAHELRRVVFISEEDSLAREATKEKA